MKKVKLKSPHSEKNTRVRTNEYKLKNMGRRQIFLNGGDRYSQRGMGKTDFHVQGGGGTNILQRGYRYI